MYKDIYDDMFYIFRVLFYEMKKERSFFMIDEELSIYVDLIIKTQRSLLSHFPQ
jgi:hypothetical protein